VRARDFGDGRWALMRQKPPPSPVPLPLTPRGPLLTRRFDLHLDEEESLTTAPRGIGKGGVVLGELQTEDTAAVQVRVCAPLTTYAHARESDCSLRLSARCTALRRSRVVVWLGCGAGEHQRVHRAVQAHAGSQPAHGAGGAGHAVGADAGAGFVP
jgi:hypothetical protein